MKAKLLAIGKYDITVNKNDLDYPVEFYNDLKKGSVVVASLFMCVTTTQSKQLAEAFGFDAWDFNKHWMKSGNKIKVDYQLLRELFGDDEVNRFSHLLGVNFHFLYLPEG